MVYFGEAGAMILDINANYIIENIEEIIGKKIKKIDFKTTDAYSEDWENGEIIKAFVEDVENEYSQAIFSGDQIECFDYWLYQHFEDNIYWDEMKKLFIDE